MPTVGSQVILCDVPMRADTYIGCSHECSYCFAQRKEASRNEKVERGETVISIKNFLEGGRTKDTRWIDFPMPVHIGGMSDPLQPIEAEMRNTYECLKLFNQHRYPVILSTKGRLAGRDDYIEVLSYGRVVMQISACCPGYEHMEPGAPSYEERVTIMSKLAKAGIRVINRMQPFMIGYTKEIAAQIPKLADAGVFGVIFEGYKALDQNGDSRMVALGADMVYPLNILEPAAELIMETVHKHGLRFYCGENRLRWMSDDLCCCGCDGMDGFQVNRWNLNHMFFDGEWGSYGPTPAQTVVGNADCFGTCMQNGPGYFMLKRLSFVNAMEAASRSLNFQRVMGVAVEPEQSLLFGEGGL